MAPRSADVLTSTVLSDPALIQKVKENPQATLTQQAAIAKKNTPLTDDPTIYRIATAFLYASMLVVTVGIFYLTAFPSPEHKQKPVRLNALVALGSACIGALGGLLSPTVFRK